MWGEAGVGGFGSGWVGRGVVRQADQGRQVRFGGWLLLGPGWGRRDDDGGVGWGRGVGAGWGVPCRRWRGGSSGVRRAGAAAAMHRGGQSTRLDVGLQQLAGIGQGSSICLIPVLRDENDRSVPDSFVGMLQGCVSVRGRLIRGYSSCGTTAFGWRSLALCLGVL